MALSKLVLELMLIDGASSAARRVASELRGVGSAGDEAGRHFDEMGRRFGNALKGMAVARTLKQELVDPGLEAAASLQEALARIEVNLDASSAERVKEQLKQVQSEAARISQPTSFSNEQVIGIVEGFQKSGMRLDDILGKGGAAEAAAKLATAEKGMSGEQAMQSMVIAGTMFGVAGEDFGRVADELSRAGKAASTDAGEIGVALSQATNVRALGLGSEETFAMLGALAESGKKGSAGGTALNAFLRQLPKANSFDELDFFDGSGQFVGLQATAESLRKAMAGRSQQETLSALQKAFGEEGASAAMALLRTDEKSYESILDKSRQARSLDKSVDVISGTFSAQREALGGSMQTALANVFQPVLSPLTAATGKANEAVSSIGAAAAENERLATGLSYGAVGLVGAAGAYSAYQLAAGGVAGARGLGGLLRGGLGTAAGVAQGKLLEQTAGVTPVFVTNWPASMGGMLGAGLPGAGGSSRLGQAGGVLSAAVGGVAVGTLINEKLTSTETGDRLTKDFLALSAAVSPLIGFFEQVARLYSGGGMANTGSVGDHARSVLDVAVRVVGGGADVEVRDQQTGQALAMSRAGGA